MLKKPLPRSLELLNRVLEALTPNRLPLTIAIDGADGCGKSSLASWLAWQLGAVTIYLDIYVVSRNKVANFYGTVLERFMCSLTQSNRKAVHALSGPS